MRRSSYSRRRGTRSRYGRVGRYARAFYGGARTEYRATRRRRKRTAKKKDGLFGLGILGIL